MKNLKTLQGTTAFFGYDQTLHQLIETQAYLERGQNEFPIDLKDSVQFIDELKEIFFAKNEVNLGKGKNIRNIQVIYLMDCSTRIKVLKSDMQMVLTQGSMEKYLEIAGFVEQLQLTLGGEVN